jgi:hypothetical protein
VTNESATPLELNIHFPADSFAIFPSPNAWLKIVLPPDTMTMDKIPMLDYGINGWKSFLDTAFHKPTVLRRTINPKEECLFYIGMLFHEARGSARSALVLKEQEIIYNIRIGSEPASIPCGKIVFRK